MNRGRLLVLDDSATIRATLSMCLDGAGYPARPAATLAAALRALEGEAFDAALVDYLLPDGTALDLLERLRESGSRLPVVLLTGYGSLDFALRAIRAGAEHFVAKPVDPAAVLKGVARILDGRRAGRREAAERARAGRQALDPFVGTSAALARLAGEAGGVAVAGEPVLIEGEPGSGKGALAAWLHANGPRAGEAFVDVPYGGLDARRLERELFGDGAHEDAAGLLDVAHRGTLFLDDVTALDGALQARLVEVLEAKRLRRVGGTRARTVDVRIVAASRVDLRAAVAEQRVREDLCRRIRTLVLRVPPLRERPEDIPALARRRLGEGRDSERALSLDAVRALGAYAWPGNVRELRSVLERAALLAGERMLTAADLGLAPVARAEGLFEIAPLDENERRYLLSVLDTKNGRVDESARALGVPLSSLTSASSASASPARAADRGA